VNDLEEPYTTPKDQPFLWMGPATCDRWPDECVGAREPSFQRLGFAGGFARRIRRRLAAELQGPGALLRPGGKIRWRYGNGGRAGTFAGRTISAGDAADMPRDAGSQSGEGKTTSDGNTGALCEPDAAAEWARTLSLLRTVRAGMRDAFVFNSAFTTVADSVRTGNCTLISNAMVHKVLLNEKTNRVRGVLYVDRNTKETREIFARVVILCAQAQESTRILLNSATREYPNGLANSSGVLGHYLTAHVRSGGGNGELPAFGEKASLGGPIKPVGIYVARFRNLKGQEPTKNFLRGFGYEGESNIDFDWRAPDSAKHTRKRCASHVRDSA